MASLQKRFCTRSMLVGIAWAVGITALGSLGLSRAYGQDDGQFLKGRIIAIGIPGPSTISPVGTFLPGGPIHDNPAFAAFTQPGKVLDPARILVGSTSNFGAPLADSTQLPGSLLSIDPSGPGILVIPSNFAAAGDQASTLGGAVQVYSDQSPNFLNSFYNKSAVTGGFTAVSNPLGLSLNNAFGRLWPANAPFGLEGIGTETIVDPDGRPLAGAPNPVTGGVYAGNLTPRQPALIITGALKTGAVGTALLGHSPDGSGKAVFAVVLANGSLVQAHTLDAVDGLVPVGTVSPLVGHAYSMEDKLNRNVTPRLGVVFNYSPTRILYISEPFQNRIAVLDLTDNGVVFEVADVRHLQSDAFDLPVDLAPATIETSNPKWASNTTSDVNGDLYVANRGNNTIIRIRQDGTLVAVRKVQLADGSALGNARLNGIAGSPDGTKIWVTVTGQLPGQGNLTGAVLELPSF